MKMKSFVLTASAVALLALSTGVSFASGYGFKKDPTANVGAQVGGGSVCDGHCKTVTTTKVKTSAAVSTKPPKAEYEFSAEGKTEIAGYGFHELGMESGLGGDGYGKADASKNPAKSSAWMDGSIVSYGAGDLVVGQQSIEGKLSGKGVDTPYCDDDTAKASMKASQHMAAVDSGHQSSSAYAGSETHVAVGAQD